MREPPAWDHRQPAIEPPTILGNTSLFGLPLSRIGLGMAGALVGFAIVLWIAANWQSIDKFQKFTIVAAVIFFAALASVSVPRVRAAATLLGVLALGGLLALYGQVYQVSSDTYVLFAVWSAVALPWTGAARSDAAWSLWVLIALTAISLWASAMHPSPNAIYLAWLMAAAIVGLLSPWSPLRPEIVDAHWAYRLAVVLALSLIAGRSILALTTLKQPDVGVLGILLLAGSVALLANARPFSLSLLALATLALDAVLLTIVTRALLTNFGSILVLGIIYAGVMAGSAVALVQIAQSRGADGFSQATSRFHFGNHWAIALISGLGALFSFILITIGVALTFGTFILLRAGPYIFGGLGIAGAVLVLQGSSSLSFRQQFGFIGLALGMGLIIFAVFRDMPASVGFLIVFAICTGIASIAPSRWIVTLMGVAGGAAATLLIASQLAPAIGHYPTRSTAYIFSGSPLAILISAALASGALAAIGLFRHVAETHNLAASRIQGFVTGWCGVLLIAELWRNPTFLVSGAWFKTSHSLINPTLLQLNIGVTNVLAVAAVLGSIAALLLHLNRRPTLPVFALAAVLSALTYVNPILAASVMIFAAAAVSRQRVLKAFAVLSVIWLIGSFYYWLGWPLEKKAYLLGTLGLGLGALCLFDPKAPRLALATTTADTSALPLWLAGILTSISVGSAAAAIGTSIIEKEAILTHGRRIFIRLAPVDPRSLMRGDYMALNYAYPLHLVSHKKNAATPVRAYADIGPQGVAEIRQFAGKNAKAVRGSQLLKVRFQFRRLIIGTNAYFFQEGTGPKYRRAKYGVFRVTPNGDAILTGLADERLEVIK